MNTFAYIQLFYLLWLIPVILIHFIELKNADIINLLPPFGAGQKIWPGLLMIASFYQGFFIITIIIPAMRQRKKALKASLIGMLIATGIYCFDVITSIAVFGAEQTKQMLWPAFELAKTVSVPGNVLERLDVIYLIVWLTAVFSATLASYYLTIHGLRELIQLRDHKLFSVFLVPFIFVITLLPQDEIYFDQLIQSALPLGLIVTICYPVLLYIVAMFRGKNETTSPAKQT
jgi:spore germination protein